MDRVDKVSVSIPASVVADVRAMAKKENRSFSNMMAVLLRESLKNKSV